MKQVKGELNWFPVTFACTRMKPRINLQGEANLGYKFLLFLNDTAMSNPHMLRLFVCCWYSFVNVSK